MSTDDHIPLFVVGLPKDEPNVELVTKKFSGVLKRIQKGISKIHEARITVKTLNIKGKRRTYEVSVLIKTRRKRFAYKDKGWDLSNICESIGQKLLRELTKNKTDKRQKQSIRKIKGKLF
jgi:ribosome-associated translation inhibitor RaiA